MRTARFAGSFYPARPDDIQQILGPVASPHDPVPAIGVICPHAGYVYSGRTAMRTLRSVRIPDTVVILCPNHRGVGHPLAVSGEDAWDTPFGPVHQDLELVAAIAAFPDAAVDDTAHAMEHSLEVQLPLIKWLSPETRMVAVSIGTGQETLLTDFASHLAICLKPDRHLIVASSDMSHYLPAGRARLQDEQAMDRILALDGDGLVTVVRENGISMCGVYPVAVMLKAARTLGANRAEVVEYTHSGVVTGDDSDVVAYLGVRIW